MAQCTFPNCEKPHIARGYCRGHYEQWKTGRPIKPLRHRGTNTGHCDFPGCDKPYAHRGLCSGHAAQRNKGKPLEPLHMTAEQRFWKHTNTNGPINPKTGTPCWLWTGALDKKGYGRLGIKGKSHAKPHRFAYELLVGPIPPGLPIDHDNPDFGCGNPSCVNPEHLEPSIRNAQRLRRLPRHNTSGERGVSWCNTNKVWIGKVAANKIVYRTQSRDRAVVSEWVVAMRAKLHG